MTRVELAKHTVETIYGTLLTLVNDGLLRVEDARGLLFAKYASITQSLVDDDSVSPEEFDDFSVFYNERIDFYRDIYLSSRA